MDRRELAVGAAAALRPERAVTDAVRHGRLIQESRRRWAESDTRDRWSLRIGAMAFVLGGAALARHTAWRSIDPLVLLLAVAALAAASLVELEVGSASAVPTEPIVVVMLLMLPAGVVPLATVAGLLASTGYLRWRGIRRESPAVAACSSAYVLGPALVLHLIPLGQPGPRWWAVIGLAYLAQVASDLAISWWRNCIGLRLGFGELVGMLRYSYTIDLLLAPGAVAAVVALHRSPLALVVALFPAALIAMLARDRARHVDRLISLGSAYTDASDQARQDALTGLGNRLAWDEAIAAEVASGTEPTGILMLDVDHLKWTNDCAGHERGDRLLVVVADVLRELAPSHGPACRLGGDEFGLLVVGPAATELGRLAASIETSLAGQPPIADLPVSVSIGFATADPGSIRQAVREADEAMYRAKCLRGASRPSSGPLEPVP